jgi:ligand-binding sensor domain-containing protein
LIYLKKNYFKSSSCVTLSINEEQVTGIRALLNSGNGFIWTGTIGSSLKQFNTETKKFKSFPLIYQGKPIGKNIQAIIKDHKGNIWLGTEGDGVIKFTPDLFSGIKKGTLLNYQNITINSPR